MSAKLIMFDGPDGVGKTTQIQRVADVLRTQGRNVLVTRINGGSAIGEALRTVYLSDVPRPAGTDFYIGQAIYEAFVEEIGRARAQYDVILSDRSPLSNVAYQSFGSGYPLPEALTACEKTLQALHPELIICYSAPLATLRQRLAGSGKDKSDYFESQPDSFFEKVLQGYTLTAAKFAAKTIDATVSEQQVHDQTMGLIAPVLSTT